MITIIIKHNPQCYNVCMSQSHDHDYTVFIYDLFA